MKASGFLKIFLLLLAFLQGRQSFAQLIVTKTLTPSQLVQNILLGSGVYVSNIVYTGSPDAIGQFSNGQTTNLGLKEGIILATGDVINAKGPNTTNGKTTDFSKPGDAFLTAIAGRQTYDAAVLEFDFTPQSDTIKFRYVFASEEYPEFVNSYNDVFGFFISGPVPGGGTYNSRNIALIPNTGIPVSVSNVNNGVSNTGPCRNCTYYFNNNAGLTIEYDGFTKVLTAWCLVVPCQLYHIKIAIADAVDGRADSGVFLEKGSFSSGTISTLISYTNPGILLNTAIEGCKNAYLTFTLPATRSYTTILNLDIKGSATNGVDYKRIYDTMVFPPGVRTRILKIEPFNDTLTEGTENVVIRFSPMNCIIALTDSIVVNILNKKPFKAVLPLDHGFCDGFYDTLRINASGGWPPYYYNWSVSVPNVPTVIVMPSVTTIYTASVSDMCKDTFANTFTVTVNPIPKPKIMVNDTSQCLNQNEFVFVNKSTIASGIINSTWKFGDGKISNFSEGNHIYSTYDTFNLTYIAVSNKGCKDSLKQKLIVSPSPVADFHITNNSQCLKGNSFTYINNSTIAEGLLTFNWHFGDNTSSSTSNTVHSYKAADSFIVEMIATSAQGCEDTAYSWANVRPSPVAAFSVNDSGQCLTGNNFIFNNKSTISKGTLKWNWTFGDGGSSTLKSPVHSYAAEGKYIIWLQCSSVYGCSDSVLHHNEVYPMPKARFVHSMPCLEDTTFFNSTSTISGTGVISLWNWDFGDGNTSPVNNPFNLYATAGVFHAALQVISSQGCSDTVSAGIRVKDHVPANILRRVTVSGKNEILIEWDDVNIGSPLSYRLEKSVNGVVYSPAGSFSPRTGQFYQNNMMVDQTSYYFRMNVTDSCGYTSAYSNIGKSILLILHDTGSFPTLSWSQYQDWASGVLEYAVETKDIASGLYTEIARVGLNTFYADQISSPDRDYFCYRVKAIRADGLESMSNTVYMENPFSAWIPNAFTPDGDGLNDILMIKGKNIHGCQIRIFDRWGIKLYESTDARSGWDGTNHGTPCPAGTYYCQVLINGPNGKLFQKNYVVNLLR